MTLALKIGAYLAIFLLLWNLIYQVFFIFGIEQIFESGERTNYPILALAAIVLHITHRIMKKIWRG